MSSPRGPVVKLEFQGRLAKEGGNSLLIYQPAGHRFSPSSLFPFLVSRSRSLVSFLILTATAVLLGDISFVYKKSLFTQNPNPHHCRHVRSSFCWSFRCRPRCPMFAFPPPFVVSKTDHHFCVQLLLRIAPGLTPSKKETTVTQFPRPTTSRR